MNTYKRILVKISGESLASLDVQADEKFGMNEDMLNHVAHEIKSVHAKGVQVALVVGGGNFFRGASTHLPTLDRATADYIGMLATVMNATALKSVLEHIGVPARHMSAIPVSAVAEPYVRARALNHLEKGSVVIFSGGTGNAFFTTDTAAVLRASELECDLLLKATKVDGIYCSDPMKNELATFYPQITYKDVMDKQLKVMDATAIALARETHLPIAVFSIYKQNNLSDVLAGQGKHTLIAQ
ncbi:MAG: UMP kinase [Alphaproteobacteria bacterium]|nr:UMP kinase [Alphaproteobacteria bacterium]